MQQQQAVAVFGSAPKGTPIKGQVTFKEVPGTGGKKVDVIVDITGLGRNKKHGFHVHEAGDLTDGCDSACAHFNPYGATHGCPGDGPRKRHVGDLGNLVSDAHGKAQYTFRDNMIRLRGTAANIIGRTLIIHADEDDCGRGGDKASLANGNSGKRIGCAVIGYSAAMFH